MTETDLTLLLRSWMSGADQMLPDIIDLTYKELKQLAACQMKREWNNPILTPTALLHEAYIKMTDLKGFNLNDRQHFFTMAAMLMRRILIEEARRRRAGKRDGVEVSLNLDESGSNQSSVDLIALDESLSLLEKRDPRQSRIVELRFFAGFTLKEIANVMGLSLRTVDNEWAMARAWLAGRLKSRKGRSDA